MDSPLARALVVILVGAVLPAACGPSANQIPVRPSDRGTDYELRRVFEVAGRQGVATDGTHYWVSGSTALYRYSKGGELLLANEEALADLGKPANHIGDIDVYEGEVYAGIEWFDEGQGQDIQIAIYDADSLEYLRSFDWEPESGQVEVSAVVVDPDHGLVWMTDWVDGRYVYRYDLATGEYRGKLHLRPVPQWQQGIGYFDGDLYITADDGDADLDRGRQSVADTSHSRRNGGLSWNMPWSLSIFTVRVRSRASVLTARPESWWFYPIAALASCSGCRVASIRATIARSTRCMSTPPWRPDAHPHPLRRKSQDTRCSFPTHATRSGWPVDLAS